VNACSLDSDRQSIKICAKDEWSAAGMKPGKLKFGLQTVGHTLACPEISKLKYAIKNVRSL
jgi:hypothetical protein